MLINLGTHSLDLSHPHVMGVLNVTPDSFSDGGLYLTPDQALRRAEAMVAEGATLIDIGGESSRPGAQPVSLDEELERVIPVIERLVRHISIPLSIDTYKPAVMQAALAAGVSLINDIYALRAPGALEILAKTDVPVCLMHMQGTPATMQKDPYYQDVVDEVQAFLAERIAVCEAHGIARRRLLIDPGFGFGKTLTHNLLLLKYLHTFTRWGIPLLVGLSRKSMIGSLLNAPLTDRLYGSVAAAVIAAWQGATILRTHDVKATVDALKICAAVKSV